MLEIIIAGGWLMFPILLCSAIAFGIICERFWSLRRPTVIPANLGSKVSEWSRNRQLDNEHINLLRRSSALGAILAAALENRHRSRQIVKEAVEDTGRHVVHSLERFLNTLGTIAGISPLLGLLGTVIGMIKVFSAIVVSGVGNANELAGGISEALITTAAGLSVAIPSYMFYRYFRGKVDRLVIEMEEQAMALVDAIDRSNDRRRRATD